MSNSSGGPPWSAPGWFEQACAWIQAELGRLDLHRTGAIEPAHQRPWSKVLRVPTSAGTIYFKASAAAVAHEPALTVALARWRPRDVAPPLAADIKHGWMLLPDGGSRLREIIRADKDLAHWERLLPIYAELQIALAERLGELLELGVPDRRLHALPAQYRRLLADARALSIGHPAGISPGDLNRLRGHDTQLAALCEGLAAGPIPATINHGDLHDGNIFAQPSRFQIFDWADACITHPFVSLRTTFVSAEISLGLPEGDAQLERLRDAYLEPWQRYAPSADLREIFARALRIAPIVGALSWDRVLSGLAPHERDEYAEPVPELLREFLGG